MIRNILWAPWRLEYVTKADKVTGCIFCEKPAQQNDRENLILYRFKTGFVIMNAFPYNNGHLMVVPYRHKPRLSDLTEEELRDLIMATQTCEKVLTEQMHPHGFNIGLNLGRCAGAGIDDHLHIHIVPRWDGDTSFLPVLSATKVLPELLSQTYEKLLIPLQRLMAEGSLGPPERDKD
ncbi:MAG: HIT domain-containing protein [Armatimonadetes bacterium]|nr:HIT domain-containing protein [Armatimonadota bacterium]MDW8122762.1 HIT domain-containing protein [Armatimonadota bacterium]